MATTAPSSPAETWTCTEPAVEQRASDLLRSSPQRVCDPRRPWIRTRLARAASRAANPSEAPVLPPDLGLERMALTRDALAFRITDPRAAICLAARCRAGSIPPKPQHPGCQRVYGRRRGADCAEISPSPLPQDRVISATRQP